MTQYPAFKKLGAGAYKPGLEATLDLAARFGNPQDRLRTVHVAGTNGKGTTASLIAAALQAAGYKTGLYTSPHLTDFLERIRVDGRMIDGEAIADFMERYHAGRPAGDFRPSFFELTTVMALEYFAREGVDVAVVEVGLGGRLDSTNIVRPDLCVITNISMDHTQILGDTPAKIAAEKAGIIKEGVPVVVGEAAGEVREVFEHTARGKGAPIIFAEDSDTTAASGEERISVDRSPFGAFATELHGAYQATNARTPHGLPHRRRGRAHGVRANMRHAARTLADARRSALRPGPQRGGMAPYVALPRGPSGHDGHPGLLRRQGPGCHRGNAACWRALLLCGCRHAEGYAGR